MFLNYQDKISKGCAFCCRWTPQPARLLSPERRCCPNSAILIISAFNNTQNVKHLNFAAESVQQERLKKATRNIPRRCRSLAFVSKYVSPSLAMPLGRSMRCARAVALLLVLVVSRLGARRRRCVVSAALRASLRAAFSALGQSLQHSP